MTMMSRLERSTTKYSLRQSPLFGLASRRKLAELLNWSRPARELDRFASREDNYRVFEIANEGKKPRAVQEPKDTLQALHRRIASLLLRVAPPEYLHSGLRGRSFVTNGRQHANGMPAIKLDIKKFYPSTSWAHVFRFFNTEMECAPDVAGLIASIACCKIKNTYALPTGSCLSQILAFYAHKKMFDEIDRFAKRRRGLFTVYVDDIMLSMPDASPADINHVGRMITRQGLQWGKERFFPVGTPKRITGTIAKPDHLEADKKQHFKYQTALDSLNELSASALSKATSARRAIGLLQSIAQVDCRLLTRAAGMTKMLMPLTRI
jgi:RNA-directed DNA polymerase